MERPKIYRDFIDALVHMVHHGQGSLERTWVTHRYKEVIHRAHELAPESHAQILLLQRLSEEERSVLAEMVHDAVVSGVFNTLVALTEFEIPPFEEGYEGAPFNDFIGRLDPDWDWPEE